jgi:FtsP/CotA-like multicopper oxidase with cupredoxin domain
MFPAWMFNGTVPGPTMRMTQGDHVQITVINSRQSAFIHSFHMHSIHAGTQDGVMTQSGMIFPGSNYTYNFIAMPAGVYPYHCHMPPVEEHISRGLYGMVIIDPPTPRHAAVEMVMLMNAYTFSYSGLNGSGHFSPTVPSTMSQLRNNLSDAIERSDENNGMPFGYIEKNSIHLTVHVPYRIYLLNMVEFDPVNSFHMHGNMFFFQESGTLQSAQVYTDILTLGQADRGILDFSYPLTGQFMFHSHINHFSDLGWVGFFNVTNANGTGQKSS